MLIDVEPGGDHTHLADRPIGWWVKHVDQLIEQSFDRVLADEGIGRRHWRVLNALAGGVATLPELDRALAPFREPGPELSTVLDQLVLRGWVRHSGTRFLLTPTGSAVRERLVKAVRAHRERVTDGVAPDRYQVTVDTLRHIARNLSS